MSPPAAEQRPPSSPVRTEKANDMFINESARSSTSVVMYMASLTFARLPRFRSMPAAAPVFLLLRAMGRRLSRASVSSVLVFDDLWTALLAF